jgi:hypothetical protein
LRKLISILLLILFIYNICGYFVIFKGMQFEIKNNMKNLAVKALPDESFEIIKIANDYKESKNIRWLEKNEFIYKEKLYDIFRVKKDKDYTYYYCINDKSEEKLFANLQKQTDNNTDNNAPINQKSKSASKLIIDLALVNKIALTKQLSIFNYQFSIYNNNYSSVESEPISPPPEFRS